MAGLRLTVAITLDPAPYVTDSPDLASSDHFTRLDALSELLEDSGELNGVAVSQVEVLACEVA